MICMSQTRWAVLLAAGLLAAGHALRAAGPPKGAARYTAPAQFTVTTDVVNADVPAFTATIGAFGNSFIRGGGGFEPPIYRSRYDAIEDSPDRIIVGPRIAHYDTLREGFLDGGTVRVYRIVDGTFVVVREETIPQGGFHCSGWQAVGGDRLVPAGTTRFAFRWDDWNRADVPDYFSVSAVDKNGNESAPAKAVHTTRPKDVKAAPNNALVRFKPPRRPSESAAPPAPGNLKGALQTDGTFLLTWDAAEAPDLAGYRIHRSDYAPQDQKGFFIQLPTKPADPAKHIKAGDFVIVDKKFYSYSRRAYCSNRVWGASQNNRVARPGLVDFYPDEDPAKSWKLAVHEADTPVEDAGETYLKLILKDQAKISLATYNHAGTGQDWYKVLEAKPYKVDVWLRKDGAGAAPVRFRLTGHFDGTVEPILFEVGSEWKKFEGTFTIPAVQPGSRPNQMALEFTGPGTFCVDNFRVYRADAKHLDYLPREYASIRESGMMSLRTHGPIKTGTRTYDMEQFTNAGGAIAGVTYQNTLPQELAMMRKAGVRPWLQVELHMSPAEWRGFVEYLAAPYDPAVDTPRTKPWAAKRHAQGQTRPWTEEFDTIYFEISNETWNWMFRPWIFESMTDATTGKRYARGEVYGLYQEFIRDAMRSSPWWKPARLDEKIVFMLGGWSGSSYGREAASASPNSRYMTIAAYNGGWDEGEGPPQVNDPSFFNVLAQVNQTAIPRAQRHLREMLTIRAKGAPGMMLGTYEAGPGYALNGLNNARVTKEQARQQERVMKSLAAGTATLDSFLARAYYGFVIQNFFTMGEGYYWKSHAKWYRGGQAYPSWKLLALFNTEALGDMLRTETRSVPSVDLPKHRRRQAVTDAPLAAVYATRRAGRVNVFVVSRKIANYPVKGDDGYIPVTVHLPFTKVTSIKLHKMAGDPRANNLTSDEAKIETQEIPVSQFSPEFKLSAARGADDRGLPPAATFLYVFEGTDAKPGAAVPPQALLPKE